MFIVVFAACEKVRIRHDAEDKILECVELGTADDSPWPMSMPRVSRGFFARLVKVSLSSILTPSYVPVSITAADSKRFPQSTLQHVSRMPSNNEGLHTSEVSHVTPYY